MFTKIKKKFSVVEMSKMLTYHRTEVIELQAPDCSYNVHKWLPNDEKYSCFVKNQIIEPGKSLVFPKFNVLFMDLKKGVRAIEFDDCKLFEIPGGVSTTFAYLEILSVRNCFLKQITRDDLKDMKHLKQVLIISNEITNLPADLFDDHPNLEAVSFYQNKISSIGTGLLDRLRNLKYADFRQNTNINACFAMDQYPHPIGDYFSRINSLENLIAIVALHCTGVKKSKRLKGTGMLADIQKFINDDKLKDLTISVKGEQFKVHKFLIAARSPTLAAMLVESPAVNDIQLDDLSPETFKKVLDFIYNENFPVGYEKMMEIYAAAGKLEITELKDFCAEELVETIEDENALELLLMSNKYGSYDLKIKAFETIKQMFPEKKLKDELADDPETIKKMLFVRKKLEKEFEDLGIYE